MDCIDCRTLPSSDRLDVAEDRRDARPERACEIGDHAKRGVSLPALDHSNVSAMYAGLVGKVFLRHAVCFAPLPDDRAESLR